MFCSVVAKVPALELKTMGTRMEGRYRAGLVVVLGVWAPDTWSPVHNCTTQCVAAVLECQTGAFLFAIPLWTTGALVCMALSSHCFLWDTACCWRSVQRFASKYRGWLKLCCSSSLRDVHLALGDVRISHRTQGLERSEHARCGFVICDVHLCRGNRKLSIGYFACFARYPLGTFLLRCRGPHRRSCQQPAAHLSVPWCYHHCFHQLATNNWTAKRFGHYSISNLCVGPAMGLPIRLPLA
mmetsp:Transcript_70976/g.140926  ORF Transcript_70976/g.140926 Transcript_70976/m.140926 type:complete len:240 (-) Transcript_70976:166-885(-)